MNVFCYQIEYGPSNNGRINVHNESLKSEVTITTLQNRLIKSKSNEYT